MAERPVLPFPSNHPEDERLAGQISAWYHAASTPGDEQIQRCVRAVQQSHARTLAPGRRTFGAARWGWGAAAAAVLLVASTRSYEYLQQKRSSASAANVRGTVTPAEHALRFDLLLPASAKHVAMVGDFNQWDQSATPMARRVTDGAWSVKVPLSPGRHVYAFVVDGKKWVVDPLAPQAPDDSYGPTNAIVVEGER